MPTSTDTESGNASPAARAAYLAQARADLAALPPEHRAELDDRYERVAQEGRDRRAAHTHWTLLR